jgi:hypothetical protein
MGPKAIHCVRCAYFCFEGVFGVHMSCLKLDFECHVLFLENDLLELNFGSCFFRTDMSNIVIHWQHFLCFRNHWKMRNNFFRSTFYFDTDRDVEKFLMIS